MSINDLIDFTEKRLANLSSQCTCAKMLGDLDRIANLEAEIATVQQVLDQLKTL